MCVLIYKQERDISGLIHKIIMVRRNQIPITLFTFSFYSSHKHNNKQNTNYLLYILLFIIGIN